MLTGLRLVNFKAWQDTEKIRLAPLSVFFGSNSSGKSSINQFLLMLKQTAQSPDRKRVLHLGDKSTAVDLGIYQDILNVYTSLDSIAFSLRWNLINEMKIEDIRSEAVFSGKSMSFTALIRPLRNTHQEIIVETMRYTLGELSSIAMEVGMERKGTDKKEYKLTSEHYLPVRNPGRAWTLPPPTRFYGFPEEVAAYYQNAGFVQDFTLEFEKQLQRICYIGPLREFPQRSYTWSGEIPEEVGWQGKLAVNAILAARDRLISPGKRKKKMLFEAMIARWLKKMGLIESFELRLISANRRDYEVMVRTAGMKEMVNVTDVGFGVSQILPVLVQCFYAPRNSTVIIEQPEIHLHPSVQASLADLFIEAVQAREDGEDRNIQLLIESHSEHFLRRLQRRIAEEKISPKDTAIYFCYPSSSGSGMYSLELDEYGNIINWPDKFFGDEIGDLRAMTEAAIKRKTRAE
ncbi:MAG: DUF3696 domain-containing protein [Desulfobacterales bacterium]|nr:DUF3696 domain-containing protein [Desulfobacterales bacterium]